MREKILVPYAPILVESTRSIGYSFEAAVADIIDNSIGKGASEINLNFMSIGNPYLAIIDNACGMDEVELEIAMRYGSYSSLETRDENDLGRFGLGLKMASMSQCRKLTVVTKKHDKIYAARWDLDCIIEKGNWVLLKFNDEEIEGLYYVNQLKQQDSGTIVIWEGFDRISCGSSNFQKVFNEKIEIARSHVSLVFHRFLGDENVFKRVKIFFNGDKVIAVDPFLTNNAATQPLTEQIILVNGNQIKVKPYILPYISKLTVKDKQQLGDINDLRLNQGFYVYRNRRLIIWGTWFRLIKQYELNKLTRVRVDIPNTLDSIWEIDIKKSSASLPSIIKQNLVKIVEDSVGRSEKVYKYRGRAVNNDNLQHIWKVVENRGSIQYLINRDLPTYKILEGYLNEKGINYLDSFIKIVEDTFPYGDVYYRLAKNENNVHIDFLEFDEVYRTAVSMIEYLEKNEMDIKSFLEKLETYDFLNKYPEVIEALREEFGNE
jgi:hypothetical protein